MNSRETEIAARKVARMLQQKPMPYKWTSLQNDTPYSLEERKEIARFLKKNQYVTEITPVDIILTKKGKEAKTYHAHRFENWYNRQHFIIRHLPTFLMGAFLGGMTIWTVVYRCEENARERADRQRIQSLHLAKQLPSGRPAKTILPYYTKKDSSK